MPSEDQNVQFLYLVLTHGETPPIDWNGVATEMKLSKGAVLKRWSRLNISMNKGETFPASTYPFLWLCVKYSAREKNHQWDAIANLCGTTKGAASKRWSRMKQAFESGAEAPTAAAATPAFKNTPVKGTPRKAKKAAKAAAANDEDDEDDDDVEIPTPSKRKRATPRKKTPLIKPEPESEDESENDDGESDVQDLADAEESPTKKVKKTIGKPKATPKPKPKPTPKAEAKVKSEAGTTNEDESSETLVKSEPDVQSQDTGNREADGHDDEDDDTGGQEPFTDAVEFQAQQSSGLASLQDHQNECPSDEEI